MIMNNITFLDGGSVLIELSITSLLSTWRFNILVLNAQNELSSLWNSCCSIDAYIQYNFILICHPLLALNFHRIPRLLPVIQLLNKGFHLQLPQYPICRYSSQKLNHFAVIKQLDHCFQRSAYQIVYVQGFSLH